MESDKVEKCLRCNKARFIAYTPLGASEISCPCCGSYVGDDEAVSKLAFANFKKDRRSIMMYIFARNARYSLHLVALMLWMVALKMPTTLGLWLHTIMKDNCMKVTSIPKREGFLWEFAQIHDACKVHMSTRCMSGLSKSILPSGQISSIQNRLSLQEQSGKMVQQSIVWKAHESSSV